MGMILRTFHVTAAKAGTGNPTDGFLFVYTCLSPAKFSFAMVLLAINHSSDEDPRKSVRTVARMGFVSFPMSRCRINC